MFRIQTCAILYFKGFLVQGNTCFSDERGCLKLTFSELLDTPGG